MSFTPAPSGWFSGLTVSATGLTIPFASLNSLDDTKADPTTGDVREVVYNFCEAFADVWANTAIADRPEQLTINTSTSVTTSGSEEVITKIYTVRVALSVADVTLADE